MRLSYREQLKARKQMNESVVADNEGFEETQIETDIRDLWEKVIMAMKRDGHQELAIQLLKTISDKQANKEIPLLLKRLFTMMLYNPKVKKMFQTYSNMFPEINLANPFKISI